MSVSNSSLRTAVDQPPDRDWPRMRDLRGKARQHHAGRIFISATGCYASPDLTESPGGDSVVSRKKTAFDPKIFLAKVGDGKQYRNIRRIRLFFRRVTLRTRFFTSRRAGSSSPSFLSGVGILEPRHFFGEGCLNGHPLRVTTAMAIDPCHGYAHHQGGNDFYFT
jgi:hypothetical protein